MPTLRNCTGSLYGQILRELRAAGFSTEHAAKAATIAELALRKRRDDMILSAHLIGWTYRQIGAAFDLSHVAAMKVVTRLTRKLPAPAHTLDPAAARPSGTGKPGVSGDGAAQVTLENSGTAGAVTASRAA